MQTITMTRASTWLAAHEALCAGQWVLARLYLDDLALVGSADSLCSLESYEQVSGHECPSTLRPIILDRLSRLS